MQLAPYKLGWCVERGDICTMAWVGVEVNCAGLQVLMWWPCPDPIEEVAC